VPIQFFHGLAIVQATLEGLERPVQLVIDSGSVSVIRRDLASQIAFEADRSVTSALYEDSMGRAIDAESILLRRVEVGRHAFEGVPAALIEPEVFDRICLSIDGVLGTGGLSNVPGFLDRVAVEMDRDLRRLRLSRDGSLLGQRGITLPLRRYIIDEHGEKIDNTSTWVPVVLGGELFWAELDTGATGLSTISVDVFTQILGRSIEEADVREYIGEYAVSAGGLGDTGRSWIASIPGVQLGRYRLGDLRFRVVQSRKDGIPLIVLGQSLLEQFNITLDYEHREIRAAVAESRPFVDILPLQLGWHVQDGRTVIVGMLADGVAMNRGIELGDEVVTVGDQPIVQGDPKSMCNATMAWQSSDSPLELRLRRDGREFEVSLPRNEP
jgi:hypothetical protein